LAINCVIASISPRWIIHEQNLHTQTPYNSTCTLKLTKSSTNWEPAAQMHKLTAFTHLDIRGVESLTCQYQSGAQAGPLCMLSCLACHAEIGIGFLMSGKTCGMHSKKNIKPGHQFFVITTVKPLFVVEYLKNPTISSHNTAFPPLHGACWKTHPTTHGCLHHTCFSSTSASKCSLPFSFGLACQC